MTKGKAASRNTFRKQFLSPVFPQGHPGFDIVFVHSSRNDSTFLNRAGIPGSGLLLDMLPHKQHKSVCRHALPSPSAGLSSHSKSCFPLGCLHGEGERKKELRRFPWQPQGRAHFLGDDEEGEAGKLRVSAPAQLPPRIGHTRASWIRALQGNHDNLTSDRLPRPGSGSWQTWFGAYYFIL